MLSFQKTWGQLYRGQNWPHRGVELCQWSTQAAQLTHQMVLLLGRSSRTSRGDITTLQQANTQENGPSWSSLISHSLLMQWVPCERPPWWETTSMKAHPEEMERTLTTGNPGGRQPLSNTTLMRDNPNNTFTCMQACECLYWDGGWCLKKHLCMSILCLMLFELMFYLILKCMCRGLISERTL